MPNSFGMTVINNASCACCFEDKQQVVLIETKGDSVVLCEQCLTLALDELRRTIP